MLFSIYVCLLSRTIFTVSELVARVMGWKKTLYGNHEIYLYMDFIAIRWICIILEVMETRLFVLSEWVSQWNDDNDRSRQGRRISCKICTCNFMCRKAVRMLNRMSVSVLAMLRSFGLIVCGRWFSNRLKSSWLQKCGDVARRPFVVCFAGSAGGGRRQADHLWDQPVRLGDVPVRGSKRARRRARQCRAEGRWWASLFLM